MQDVPPNHLDPTTFSSVVTVSNFVSDILHMFPSSARLGFDHICQDNYSGNKALFPIASFTTDDSVRLRPKTIEMDLEQHDRIA